MLWVIVAILAIIIGFLKDIAPVLLLLVVCVLIYGIIVFVKFKIKDIKSTKISTKKEAIINELKEQLSHKQDILKRFEKYYCGKKRVFNFVTLISNCNMNTSRSLSEDLNVFEMSSYEHFRKDIFSILSKTEKQLFPTAIDELANYKTKLEKDIMKLKSDITSVASTNESGLIEIIESSCPILKKDQKKKRIKIIISCWTCFAIIIASIAINSYINNTPYRELQEKIDDQTLTVEMLEWSNRDSENSYYEYLHSEKGYKFLADVFTELHRNNEIEKALWLLCIQPDCIDGIDLCASDSFIDWVVNYAKQNGTKKEQSDGDITYCVNGYEIRISSIFDYSIGHTFHITNGKESTSVEKRNPYHDGSVPTIK